MTPLVAGFLAAPLPAVNLARPARSIFWEVGQAMLCWQEKMGKNEALGRLSGLGPGGKGDDHEHFQG